MTTHSEIPLHKKVKPHALEAWGRYLCGCILVAGAYYAAGRLSLLVALSPGIVSPVWLPSGIAVAALLKTRRFWPAVWAGSFAVNGEAIRWTGTDPFLAFGVAAAIASGSTLQALAVSWGIRRFALSFFDHVRQALLFLLIACVFTVIAATVGVSSLYVSELILPSRVGINWIAWWLGDAVGILVITPWILAFGRHHSNRGAQKTAESWLFFILFGLASGLVFRTHFTDSFLILPFIAWAAVRFGEKRTTTVIVLSSCLAIAATATGFGPFAILAYPKSIMLLQLFVGTLCGISFFLGASSRERRQALTNFQDIQQRMELAVESGRMGIWEWDCRTGKVQWSRDLERIHGLKDGSFGGSFEDFQRDMLPEDRPRVLAAIEKVLTHPDEFYRVEYRIRVPSGETVWLEARGQVFRDADGNPQRMTGVCMNISLRKELEAASRRYQDELQKAYERMEDQVEERTRQLVATHEMLRKEMGERMRIKRELLRISEREQKRIGQDLHDSIAQQFAGISMLVRILADQLQKEDSTHAAQASEILILVKKAIEETKRLSRTFYPVELQRFGLPGGLQDLAAATEQMFGIHCELDIDESVEIENRETASHLYRITQEALHNAARHGKARYIAIQLKQEAPFIRLTIEDDGIGMPETTSTSGMGLKTMEYRTILIGARLKIDSRSNEGTRITVLLPHALRDSSSVSAVTSESEY